MIVFDNIEHGFKIATAIPRPFNPDIDKVISKVTPEGNLMGGVIYDGFTGGCIFMHQAGFSKNWLVGDMMWIVFDYPFNKELLDFNLRLGFKEEARIKNAYRDGDMVVLTMERAACRWLKIKPKVYKKDEAA
jgi:hypothetical protein